MEERAGRRKVHPGRLCSSCLKLYGFHRMDSRSQRDDESGRAPTGKPETSNQTGIKKGRRGLVTLPFLIGFVIVMFLILSFFRLTLTLTYASVMQYITYASARRLSLGDADKGAQIDKGKEKYNSLKSRLLKTGEWFEVSDLQMGFRNDYTEAEKGYRRLFYGASVSFTSNLISFRIPFLAEEGDQGLTAVIGSYLGREPSKKECDTFNTERASRLKSLMDSAYPEMGGRIGAIPEDSVSSDNGC